MKKRLIIPTIALALGFAASANAADLTLEIKQVEKSEGQLLIAVWDSAEGFLKAEAIRYRGRIEAKEGTVTYTLSGMEPGDYAVSVFHDIDSDGKLKKNFMGAPTEPLGMSRDAKGVFGPPAFEDAVFTLPKDGAKMEIYLD
jgi:uncharacterized protein (DUF2141 family)